ncbi:hypothetical protein DH2020_045276 [Rehmannia glutinosa]|uniref:Uncharacterized protein n=1 Tax=Rehmannia glutinosa TaxID=99300 RepID=A0ABR0UEK4_REHGL
MRTVDASSIWMPRGDDVVINPPSSENGRLDTVSSPRHEETKATKRLPLSLRELHHRAELPPPPRRRLQGGFLPSPDPIRLPSALHR